MSASESSVNVGAANSGTNSGNGNITVTTGESLRIIKTQLVPHPLTAVLQRSHSPIQHSPTSIISRPVLTPTPPSSIIAPNSPKTVHQTATQLKNTVNVTNLFSLNPVAAKISHIKTATIEGIATGGNPNGTISINNLTMTGSGNSGIPTGTIVSSATMNAIKVGGNSGTVPSTIVATSLAMNTSQTTNSSGATSIRAIGAGGQSTQVRVVMGNLMAPSMIKQIENATGGGRTQISTFSATPARSLNNTSITVTRSPSQYMPRASVTATPISGISVPSGQRLVTPIRATPASVTVTGSTGGTIAGIAGTSNFVRNAALTRNVTSSSVSTVISPTTSTTWMATNPTGQVQLIRAIPHQTRNQRGTGSVVAVTGTMITATATSTINGAQSTSAIVTTAIPQVVSTTQHHQQGKAIIQAVSSANQSSQSQQTYVATVLPPRQHQATLVYSSNPATSQPLTQGQFNPTSVATATGPRFAVASPIVTGTGTTTTTVVPRQIRPIPLAKPFSTAKLNTTNISIRTPSLPQLTPTITSNVTISNTGTPNASRTTTLNGGTSGSVIGGTTTNVIPSTNLSTTRIIQLQQQTSGTQQILSSTGRLATNVMLQPIIVNTSGSNKFGIRPPVTMAAKVQPSLTITQLGIGKLPNSSATGAVATSGGTSVVSQQQNLLNNCTGSSSISTAAITATNLTSNAPAQLINVSHTIGGQLITPQNMVSSSTVGSTSNTTVVPLAIGSRSACGNNIIAGTVTPLKNISGTPNSGAITIGKVMTQAQLTATLDSITNSVNSTSGTIAPANVYIHHNTVSQRPTHPSNSNANVTVGISSGTSNISNANTMASNVLTSGNVTTGTFLQPGSTIYYESLPANSMQMSTGVLSLSTTTVTTSAMPLTNQIVSSGAAAAANLSISSIPFATHVTNGIGSNTSTATFTVVPSVGGRTIGQVQIPVSSATQIQALPVRFSQLPLAGGGGGGGTGNNLTSATSTPDTMTVSQTITPQLIQQTTISGIDTSSQIIIPSNQQQQNNNASGTSVSVINASAVTGSTNNGSQPQHMLIPLQTSIKMATGSTSTTSGATVVSNFIRKRENEGSPIRAAKNLGPTFISMGSVSGNSVAVSNCTTINNTYNLTSIPSSNVNINKNALIMDGATIKERINSSNSNTNNKINNNINNNISSNSNNNLNNNHNNLASGIVAHNNSSSIILSTPHTTTNRATDSPASSDGSTTVSANSSPGIEQQLQDNNNIVVNRMVLGSNVTDTHFNPINDLYENNHNQPVINSTQRLIVSGAPVSTRNILPNIAEHSSDTTTSNVSTHNGSNSQHQQQQRCNGNIVDCPPRKKLRRSTNDGQTSNHSQTSLSLPPPLPPPSAILAEALTSQSTSLTNDSTITVFPVNNVTIETLTHSGPCTVSQSPSTTTVNSVAVTESLINGKENTKPVEYILKRPRNCTLLSTYKPSWKSTHNHFQRYSDVKPREERKPSIMDLANQTNVLGKINGWKIYHLKSQMEDLCESESLGYDKLSNMLKQMESHGITSDIERISDLLKGNMQRSKIIVDGVNEAQNQIMRIFDHKAHVSDIINRCASKRNYKKRDKTY